MSNEYCPDSWVVFKVKETGLYKVLAGWSGGYTSGDSWRMNSGIVSVDKQAYNWEFYGTSGSVYVCHQSNYGVRMSTVGVFDRIKDKVELLRKDTNWYDLDYGVGNE